MFRETKELSGTNSSTSIYHEAAQKMLEGLKTVTPEHKYYLYYTKQRERYWLGLRERTSLQWHGCALGILAYGYGYGKGYLESDGGYNQSAISIKLQEFLSQKGIPFSLQKEIEDRFEARFQSPEQIAEWLDSLQS